MADVVSTRPGVGTRLRRAWVLHPERNLQIAIAIVAALLFVSPVAAVLIGAFRTSPFTAGPNAGEWSLQPILEVMGSDRTWLTLLNTFVLTVASVVPGILIAVFFATLVTRTNALGKWVITITMAVLVAVPPLFYALTWTMLADSTSGLLNVALRGIATGFAPGQFEYGAGPFDINSWGGLILVSTLRATGFMYLLLIGPFNSMDRTLEEAARVSGAGSVRTFFGTQIPTLMPAIAAVFIGASVASFEAFDVPVMIGSPAGIYVLPTEVYNYLYAAQKPLYGQAMAVSIILLVILIGLLVLERRARGRRQFTTVSGKGARQSVWQLGAWRVPVLLVTVLFALIAVVLPFLQLLLVSVSPYMGWNNWGQMFEPGVGLTGQWFTQILSDPDSVAIFVRTAGIAALAALIAVLAVIVVLWAARLARGPLAAVLDSSQLMPMVVPGLLLALGIIVIVLMGPWRTFYGSAVLLIAGLFITVVPLGNRSLAGAIVQIPAELEEATRVAGGSRARALVAVVVRLVLPSALNGWLLAFIVASGTLAMPMLLGDRNAPMLAVKVYTDTVTNANYTLAAAQFVLFIGEILVLAAIIQLITWAIRRSTAGSRAADLVGASADPDWTGAVVTRRRRKALTRALASR
ncbi:ABC transporter permease subunit [Microbacterium sp. NPDC096154]|uniref:ABC transporter permease n=1 Tax=Microbacterium sp. NPDC096154 TaxID=3155549 RepID=UPI00331FE0F6